MSQMHSVGKTATSIGVDRDGTYSVRYHSTDVVRFNTAEIILNTGGWFTNTTKTRMNQASNQFNLGYRVWQKDFIWYVSYGGKDYEFDGDAITLKRK